MNIYYIVGGILTLGILGLCTAVKRHRTRFEDVYISQESLMDHWRRNGRNQ